MARARGYMTWRPRADAAETLDNVNAVFRTYRDNLPLTVRQVFYRLVAAYAFPKDERAYKRLAEWLVKARRAQLVPFSYLRDDGIRTIGGDLGYSGLTEFWETELAAAQGYERKKQEGQPQKIELWCEAAGMMPQLQRVAEPYGVPVHSSSGFVSLTAVRQIVDRVKRENRPTVLLHVGDYDPSGESIFESMTDDARQFLFFDAVQGGRAELSPIRVALTEAQVEEHDLPTAPAKASDSRSATWVGETCQAEALPPDLLQSIVRDAIEQWVDQGVLADVRRREEEEREEIVAKVETFVEEARGDD